MPSIKIGDKNIADAYYGEKRVNQIYYGPDLVWERPPMQSWFSDYEDASLARYDVSFPLKVNSFRILVKDQSWTTETFKWGVFFESPTDASMVLGEELITSISSPGPVIEGEASVYLTVTGINTSVFKGEHYFGGTANSVEKPIIMADDYFGTGDGIPFRHGANDLSVFTTPGNNSGKIDTASGVAYFEYNPV